MYRTLRITELFAINEHDVFLFLPPANEVWGKVIFSEACVKNSVHRGVCMVGGCMVAGGVCGCGGHAWLWGACMAAGVVHGCEGACMVVGGMCGCRGACVVAGGACMVVGGVHRIR